MKAGLNISAPPTKFSNLLLSVPTIRKEFVLTGNSIIRQELLLHDPDTRKTLIIINFTHRTLKQVQQDKSNKSNVLSNENLTNILIHLIDLTSNIKLEFKKEILVDNPVSFIVINANLEYSV